MFEAMLKKIITVAACLSATMAFGETPETTTLTCRIHNNTGSSVFLYTIENGEAVSLGFKWPAADNTCSFSFAAKQEGVYFLRKGGNRQQEFNYVFYMKPGDNTIADIYASRLGTDFDSCKINQPNEETGCLQAWAGRFNAICKLGVLRAKREQFFTAYNDFLTAAAELKKKCLTSGINTSIIYSLVKPTQTLNMQKWLPSFIIQKE